MEPSMDDFLCASHSDFVTLGMSTCIAGGPLRADYPVSSLEKTVSTANIPISSPPRQLTQSPKVDIKQDL